MDSQGIGEPWEYQKLPSFNTNPQKFGPERVKEKRKFDFKPYLIVFTILIAVFIVGAVAQNKYEIFDEEYNGMGIASASETSQHAIKILNLSTLTPIRWPNGTAYFEQSAVRLTIMEENITINSRDYCGEYEFNVAGLTNPARKFNESIADFTVYTLAPEKYIEINLTEEKIIEHQGYSYTLDSNYPGIINTLPTEINGDGNYTFYSYKNDSNNWTETYRVQKERLDLDSPQKFFLEICVEKGSEDLFDVGITLDTSPSQTEFIFPAPGYNSTNETPIATWVDTTPADMSYENPNDFTLNFTITNASLADHVILEFNGTNYTWLGNSPVKYNMDNVANLGEDSSKIVDIANYGLIVNGSNSGSTVVSSTVGGNARSFDGNDYIDLPNFESDWDSGSGAELSFAFWFKADFNGGANRRAFSDLVLGQYEANLWGLASNGNTFGSINGASSGGFGITSSSWTTGKWYHVAMTINSTGWVKSYLDGSLTSSVSRTPANYENTGWAIGRVGSYGSHFWRGDLDEFQFYHFELSEEQVIDLNNSYFRKWDEDKWILKVDKYDIPNGSYTINCYVNSSSGNSDSCGSRTFNVGGLPPTQPQFSDFTTSPANNSEYSASQEYFFNTTITHANHTVGIEFNGVNYTVGNGVYNVSNEYYFNTTGLAIGEYNYYWWAYGNESTDLFNYSDTFNYVILPAGDSKIMEWRNLLDEVAGWIKRNGNFWTAGNINASGNISGNEFHVEIWGEDIGEVNIASSGVYYNVTNLTLGEVNGFDFNTSGYNELMPHVKGRYLITSQWSFSGGANTEYHLAVSINGTKQSDCHAERTIGTGGDVGSASFTCIKSLYSADNMNLVIENVDSAVNPTIHNIQLNIVRVGDL